MAVHKPKYTKDEYAQRGTDIYERNIRPIIEEGNRGKIVAIDIESGNYEIADDTLIASDRLFLRLPEAQIWFVRFGYPAVHRIAVCI